MVYEVFKNQFSVAVLRHLRLPCPVGLLPPVKRSFRMRHQTENSAFSVADSSNVVERPVRVCWKTAFRITAVLTAIPQHHHVVLVQVFKELLFFFSGKKKTPFRVRNGYFEHFSLADFGCEYAFALVFLFEVDPAAVIALWNIRGEGGFGISAYAFTAWEQAVLNENLEAVAYAENRSAVFNEGVDFFAQLGRQPPCQYCASAPVISEREAAWKNQNLIIQEVSAFNKLVHVQGFSLNAQLFKSPLGFRITVGAAHAHNTDFYLFPLHLLCLPA